MSALTKINKLLAEQERIKSDLTDRLLAALRRTFLRCSECGRESQVSSWVFIQDHWYVPPSGCTEGAYWKSRKANTCHLRCPKCGQENYICHHPQIDKILMLAEHWVGKQGIFKQVKERYQNH